MVLVFSDSVAPVAEKQDKLQKIQIDKIDKRKGVDG